MMLRTLIIMSVLCLAPIATSVAADGTSVSAPAARKTVVIEDFESYTSAAQMAKAWYKPPHGVPTHLTLESVIKGGGKQGLKVQYSTTKQPETHYSAFCRVAKWDLSGCDAFQFWLKPDGSGRQLTVELNISNREGKNIHDLWSSKYVPAKGDTAARIVSVPFAKLVHNTKYADSPDVSPVFKPEAVIEVAFYIGGRSDEPGEGVYYFDDLKAVATKP